MDYLQSLPCPRVAGTKARDLRAGLASLSLLVASLIPGCTAVEREPWTTDYRPNCVQLPDACPVLGVQFRVEGVENGKIATGTVVEVWDEHTFSRQNRIWFPEEPVVGHLYELGLVEHLDAENRVVGWDARRVVDVDAAREACGVGERLDSRSAVCMAQAQGLPAFAVPELRQDGDTWIVGRGKTCTETGGDRKCVSGGGPAIRLDGVSGRRRGWIEQTDRWHFFGDGPPTGPRPGKRIDPFAE